jgi:hypothetical protein
MEVSQTGYGFENFFVAIVFFAIFLWSCVMTNNTMNKTVTKIVYHFKDASVPPQYHRSYTITVTRDQAHIVVDSYGDIVADATTDIPEQIMDDLVKFIEIYQIEKKNRKRDTMKCTGGTSKSLTVYSDDNILLDGTVYQCGGRMESSISGDIDSFTKKLEGLVPDFINLLK